MIQEDCNKQEIQTFCVKQDEKNSKTVVMESDLVTIEFGEVSTETESTEVAKCDCEKGACKYEKQS